VLSKLWDPKDKYWFDRLNCIKVDPTSPGSIAVGVVRLINNKSGLRDRIIESGYRVLKKHNYRKIGKKFLKILGT